MFIKGWACTPNQVWLGQNKSPAWDYQRLVYSVFHLNNKRGHCRPSVQQSLDIALSSSYQVIIFSISFWLHWVTEFCFLIIFSFEFIYQFHVCWSLCVLTLTVASNEHSWTSSKGITRNLLQIQFWNFLFLLFYCLQYFSSTSCVHCVPSNKWFKILL